MPTIKVLSDAEYRKLKSWLIDDMPHYFKPRKYERNYLAILFMLECGLRVGELVQLKWKYFQNLSTTSGYLRIPAHLTKTKQGRDIPLHSNVSAALGSYRCILTTLSGHFDQNYLFPRAFSFKHMTTRNIQFIVRFIGLAALNKEIHCHMLRHTFATRLLRVTNIRIVQELMGHSKLNSTQIYTHPNSNDLRTAIDKMSNSGKGCDRHEL